MPDEYAQQGSFKPDGMFYAGVPALIDVDGTIANHVAQHFPASQLPFAQQFEMPERQFTHPLFSRQLPLEHRSPYPKLPNPQLGQWILPTGCARHSQALLAFGQDEMLWIAKQAFGFELPPPEVPDEEDVEEDPGIEEDPPNAFSVPDGTLTWGKQHNPLDLIYRYNGYEIRRTMYALTPYSFDMPFRRNLWILPLVDVRYFWQRVFRAKELELLDEDGWDDVFPKLADVLSPDFELFVDHEPVDDDYFLPDRKFLETESVGASASIDIAALSINLRPVLQEDFTAEVDPDETEEEPEGEDEVENQRQTGNLTIELQNLDRAKSLHVQNMLLPTIRAGGVVPREPLSEKLTFVFRKLINHFTNLDEAYFLDVDLSTAGDDEEEKSTLTRKVNQHQRIVRLRRTFGLRSGRFSREMSWTVVFETNLIN